MSDATPEQQEHTSAVADGADLNAADSPASEGPQEHEAGSLGKLVPVQEAIRYRRRAQQAEAKLQQLEQQLKDLQRQLDDRLEQLGTADAQRDELQHQLETERARHSAEQALHAAGVTDIETAMTLLEKRANFSDDPDGEKLQREVQRLLQDKPFLLAPLPALPDKTASPRLRHAAVSARLAEAATQAARTGNRQDVAEYLRLRRQANPAY